MRTRELPIYLNNREKLNWRLPTLFCNDEVIFSLISVLKELKIKHPFASVYGSIKCSWSGGRSSITRDFDKKKTENIIKRYNDEGISCCFTFSSVYIEEKDLKDKVGNELLKIANNSNISNYAIVSSDILANYIRAKYPNIKLISSLVKLVKFPQS